ncbi:MAG: cbb3-type cytochrome oxidase assembly protein CcoS [Betaproteobacteria bacterium]|nr:cbb3-type cytochrome oxidase assembly protein CcoS [Betaproteobacteria bacterium]MCL2885618.1 cbb3-type cytochrome oxidase assembly protein CcoS [Betaproteobacteria bacterium]
MESVYLLIPISVLLVFGIAAAFWWSVRSGQFDDLEGPGFRVLMDDEPAPPENERAADAIPGMQPVAAQSGSSDKSDNT